MTAGSSTPLNERRIDPRLARSWLLVPAGRPDAFDAASASKADQVVLDIEDAVGPSDKAAARLSVAQHLDDGGEAWVRVNDRTSPWWEEDLSVLRGRRGLRGVILAKAESAHQVADTFDLLGGTAPIIALCESALAVEDAVEIAGARGCIRLAFGSGDYRRDTGTAATELAMAYPRSRLVIASRIGRLSGPIDGPTVLSDVAAVRADSVAARALGMTGRLCLHESQSAPVDEEMSPSSQERAWARGVVADARAGGGAVSDGSDLPRRRRAEQILAHAHALGLPEPTGARSMVGEDGAGRAPAY